MSRLSMLERVRFPHPLTLLMVCIGIAAVASWVVPAGEFERRQDATTGRTVVVAGTYHAVDASPVGPFGAVLAIPRGLIDAADVIFLVFLAGGAFLVVDRTGALRAAVDALARTLRGREVLVIPVVSIFFATGGALQNTQEEIVALMPVLLLLAHRVGFDALTAAAMSLGAAAVGAAFSPINPFQVVIAQQLAELPALSGAAFRIVFLLIAVTLWTAGTVRHALRSRLSDPVDDALHDATVRTPTAGGRNAIVLGLVLAAFALFTFGLLRLGWGFNEMSAVFLAMGIAAGLIGGLGVHGTAEAFVEGFREMAYAAVLIGFARAIYVVLADGRIVDTLVHGLFIPTAELPLTASALAMLGVQTLIHIPVPSVSGQAVLTIPILTPLSDLIGLSRQVMVLAYQYGAGLCDVITPTNGALMAVLAAAGVRYDRWLRFALPLWAMLLALGGIAVVTAIAVGIR